MLFKYGEDTPSTEAVESAVRLGVVVRVQQIRQDLIDVAFPFWQIGNGQDGIDSVVPSAVDGLNVKTIQLKNECIGSQRCVGPNKPVVPHIICFLVEREG